jgi:glutamate N-acetyltransferase / amino-acid N-acetyltransferase
MEKLPELSRGPLKEPAVVSGPVAGFKAAAAAAGVKYPDRNDVALIAADRAVPAAGVFTSNLLPAAPVVVSREHIAQGKARAILANSGNANAATGAAGLDACRATCAAAAAALGCPVEEVLPCSTGVIGQILPGSKIEAVCPELVQGLEEGGLPTAVRAIMTTDAFPKMAEASAVLGGLTVRVVGLAKGAGMIRPDMATMLSFVLTDAAASSQALAKIIAQAAEQSFNRATVDGDTSTNDTLLIMASGAAGNQILEPEHPDLPALGRAVTSVCRSLAAMMVADGEGASHLIRVKVTGAASDGQARHIAYAIAHSPLVKTAFYGRDANWGRILSAAASESARRNLDFRPEKTSLFFGPAQLVAGGVFTTPQAEEMATREMGKPRYEVHLDLGLGRGWFWLLTSDLTHEYIDENASYRS